MGTVQSAGEIGSITPFRVYTILATQVLIFVRKYRLVNPLSDAPLTDAFE